MISKNLNDKINEQIQHELYSGHFYLAMAAYCSSSDLDGFANFFIEQEKEERAHAMKFYHYVNDQGGTIRFGGIDEPQSEFESLENVFDLAWKHEQKVTGLLNNLMDVAVTEKDYASQALMNWFISEQVEEEATMLNILNQVKMLKNSPHGILMLDREMAQRAFTPPPAE